MLFVPSVERHSKLFSLAEPGASTENPRNTPLRTQATNAELSVKLLTAPTGEKNNMRAQRALAGVRTISTAIAVVALGVVAYAPSLAGAVALPPDGNPALWTPEERLEGFKTIAKIYGGDPVHHGSAVMPLPKHPLKLHYDSAGVSWDA